MSAPEEWREVPGTRWRVSSIGRVSRLDRGAWREPSLGTPCGNGYRAVGVNGRHMGVHVMVALAFHGPAPSTSAVARHLNDIRDDNRVENIAWGSRAENLADAVRNGRRDPGVRDEVVRLAGSGLRASEIARRVGVSHQRVHQIVSGYRSPANARAANPTPT